MSKERIAGCGLVTSAVWQGEVWHVRATGDAKQLFVRFSSWVIPRMHLTLAYLEKKGLLEGDYGLSSSSPRNQKASTTEDDRINAEDFSGRLGQRSRSTGFLCLFSFIPYLSLFVCVCTVPQTDCLVG